MRVAIVLTLSLLATLATPEALAQSTDQQYIHVTGSLDKGSALVSRLNQPGYEKEARFRFTYADVSAENVNTATVGQVTGHTLEIDITWDGGQPRGWSLNFFTSQIISTRAGDRGEGEFAIYHTPSTQEKFVHGKLVLRLSDSTFQQNDTLELPWVVQVAPYPAASISPNRANPEKARPFEQIELQFRIENLDVYPATYRVSAEIFAAEGIDPTAIAIMGTGDHYLQPGEQRNLTLRVITPRDLFWYNSIPMTMLVAVEAPGGTGRATTLQTIFINGFYVSENLILLVLAFLLQLFLLIFLIVFAKRQYERRFLGRPIPPWQIPEERAHLDRLKREDPRAHYVLRYFLMEEEYRSALLWFYAYKKISKRQLRAEARAVSLREKADEMQAAPAERLSKAFERVQRRYQRKIERRQLWIERKGARLQGKLEANQEKDFDQDHEKWEKRVEKLKAKANRPQARAHKKWEKQVEKILAKWEKPIKKQKEKHDKAFAKALEKYVKQVKKADKPAYRAWKEAHEDWEGEVRLAKKEGHEPPPEPVPQTDKTGPPNLPEPFIMPPKPDLPPEPQAAEVRDLPPEPQMSTPTLAASHYAKDVRKVEKKGWKEIRKLEREMAAKLDEFNARGRHDAKFVAAKREKYLEAASTTAKPGFVDVVLRRSPGQVERRHQLAYLRGLTKSKIQEAEESEALQVERVRLESAREEAVLEAQIIRERTALRRAARLGKTAERQEETAKVAALEEDLRKLRAANAKRVQDEGRSSKARLASKLAQLQAEEKEALEREMGKPPPAAAASPQS